MMKKQCTKCGRILDSSEFHKNKKYKNGLRYQCKECVLKYQKERCITLRLEVMVAFGGQCVYVDKNGIRCPKNSIDDLDDLTLSHPNNDGDEHRDLISNRYAGCKFYKALKDRNWDTDGFVVEIRCRSHHSSFDRHGKYGKLHPNYKKGKFNDPEWLRKKYATMSARKIAKECGVSESTIWRRMIKFGYSRFGTGRRT